MQNQHKKSLVKPVRAGSAGTLLLIIIVLVIAILIAKAVIKNAAKEPDTALNHLEPWAEWQLRQSAAKPAEVPSVQQPDISRSLQYHAAVSEDGQGRGDMDLIINPDGSVSGNWGGYYWRDKLNFDVQGGGFKGFVCPGKIYQDDRGKEPSKLYFIAKGKFLIHESDLKQKYQIRGGDLYVTGWLGKDYLSDGKLIITSDEKYCQTFTWKAAPVKK